MSAAEDRLNELLRAARKQVEAGDRPQALRTFQKALDMDPGNDSIREEMLTIEREAAAMETFKRTRSARAHAPEGAAASAGEGFIEECLRRSSEAVEAGDDIRALQELERARRQDPENSEVQKRIKQVKRSIKANNLADLGMTRLRSGDPFGALDQVRKIFEFWPGSPALEQLVTEMEGFDGAWVSPAQPSEAEEIEFEDVEETSTAVRPSAPAAAPRPAQAPARAAGPSREDAAIASIREKIARSAYADALAEARAALNEHPSNPILLELASKLEKVAAPAPKAPPATAEPRVAERVEPEALAPAPRKRIPLVPIVAVLAVLAVAAVLFLVILKPRPSVPVVPAVQPYNATLVLQGPPGAVLNLDGNPLQADSAGRYVLSGVDFGNKQIEVRAEGYELLNTSVSLSQGQILSDTLVLQPLGTSRSQVSFDILMPEGEAQPQPGLVTFLVDGQPAAASPVDLPTGLHVFQAILEGYNSLPESILIDTPGPFAQQLALLSPETSQISLSLAAGITGNAVFYLDGAQVGTG
jgi:tetratricopeptide (TPR) repeat protein